MTDHIKRHYIKCALFFLCIVIYGCGDLSCKDITSSSLRRYEASDRIETINKEITILQKKDNDLNAIARLGDLNEQLATIYLEKEDFSTALLHINKAFENKRNTPYLNFMAGLAHGNIGAKSGSKDEISQAEKYYRHAIELKENYEEAWYALAVLLFLYKNERKEPIKILEDLCGRSPWYYTARFALGRFYYESGRKEDALNIYLALQTDLEKLPNSPVIREYIQNSSENIQRIRAEMQINQEK